MTPSLKQQKLYKAKIALEEKKQRAIITKAENRLIRSGDFGMYRKVCLRDIQGKTPRDTWYDPMLDIIIENIISGEEPRVIVEMPTRYGKTERFVRLLASFALGRDPTRKIQYATYGDTLSRLTSVDIKMIMEHPKYKSIFPNARISKNQNEKTMWVMQKWGSYLGTSVGGAVTGAGADITLADDLLKASDAYSPEEKKKAYKFLVESLMSRMEDEAQNDEIDEEKDTLDGSVVMVMQRLAEDDVVGRLIEEQGIYKKVGVPVDYDDGVPVREDGVWLLVSLKALVHYDIEYRYEDFYYYRKALEPLDIRKHTRKQLERKRRDMGSSAFEKQFNQTVENPETGYFSKEDITFISEFDLPEMAVYISVDRAESVSDKADDRAIAVVGWSVDEDETERQVLLDGRHGKWGLYEIVDNIIFLMMRYKDAEVKIEEPKGGFLSTALNKEVLRRNAKLRQEGRELITNPVDSYLPPSNRTKQYKISLGKQPIEQHLFKVCKSCDSGFYKQWRKELLMFDPNKRQQMDNCIDASFSTFLFATPKRIKSGERAVTKRIKKHKRDKVWRGI